MSRNEILANNKQDAEFETLFGYSREEKVNVHLRNLYHYWIFKLPELLVYMMQLGIVIVFGIGAIRWTNTIGDFAMFVWLLGLIQKSLFDLLGLIRRLDFDRVHIQKLWDVMDNAPTQNIYDWVDYIYKKWDICLTDITFWYDSDKPVFDRFNLQIPWGTVTALVGESWWGKSTLMKLIAWYIQPDSGSIEVDGQQISHQSLPLSRESEITVNVQSYYRHIGYLTQEPSVFDGTIYENLVYGVPQDVGADSIRPRIEQVIIAACCQFIYDLPQGLDTEIGERGIRLSWWQKQRLAIAKIMLKNPHIILLDEPTSALDSMNEELVSKALRNLFEWKTVIVIAHRLQTVKNADRILYIGRCSIPLDKEGIEGDLWSHILEQGTHDELVALWWHYKRMLDLQSGF